MNSRRTWLLVLLASTLAVIATAAPLARAAAPGRRPLPILGHWNVTMTAGGRERPAAFDLSEDEHGLSMNFLGVFGAPVHVPFVTWDGHALEFQLESGERWRGEFDGRFIRGTAGLDRPRWVASRAPRLAGGAARWGEPRAIFDGRTLAGWQPRYEDVPSGWTVRDGALANVFPRVDLRTLASYENFKLSLRFRLEPGSDSGVHLRGRYEIQLTDRTDPAAFAGGTGSIYGRVPAARVDCPAGAWHTLEATLVGREVTVLLDGVTVIDHATIDGITGDALDSREAAPGPIVLQGYLGRVEFRDLVLTPAR